MRIIPLSEGSFTIDHSKVFVPFDTGKDDLQERPRGSLLVEIQPFLVDTGNDLILLDSGLGYSKGGVLQLFENITKAGYEQGDVTKILMSHLHRDHAGGLAIHESYGSGYHLAFPQADHYISKDELLYATRDEVASADAAPLKSLLDNDKVCLLDGSGSIDGYIQYEWTGGHSRFHQVFHIEGKGQHLFFGGDEAPQLKQMKTRFIAKYDQDGKRAMELRHKWWEQAQKEHWTFLFYHDISTPYFTC